MTQIDATLKKKIANLGFVNLRLDMNKDIPYWSIWPIILSDNKIAKILFDEFKVLVSSISTSVDYFCPLPTSGLMLIPTVLEATGLSAITYKKPASIIDSTPFWNEKQIKKQCRVLLIDDSINTGDALATAFRQVGRIKCKITDIAVMVYNDIAIEEFPNRLALLKSVNLHHLLTVSELLTAAL